MSRNNDLKIAGGNGEERFPVETGIGALLREQREKKGLSYAGIFEMIRLRPPILEAMENEDWEGLPSPIFVRGFVRSYARALGLDEAKALELYRKAVPFSETPLRPLARPVGSRPALPVTLIFLLLAGAFAYYFLKAYPNRERDLTNPYTVFPASDKVTKSNGIQKVPVETIPQLSDQQIETDSAPETHAEIIDTQPTNDVIEDSLSLESAPAPKVEAPALLLKAHIGDRTWLRISVDGQVPKEYIFQPGSYPEWTAREGFELFIGNAGGIELELNGEKFINLGDPGEVISLKLPRDYEARGPND
ncbi:MAG: DUF4115 domain-containing protein [Thermodesulfobacteriota bacterium]|nr:DUF4115 domain-containing protein [Thermodesulfobacteriota bacterium]